LGAYLLRGDRHCLAAAQNRRHEHRAWPFVRLAVQYVAAAVIVLLISASGAFAQVNCSSGGTLAPGQVGVFDFSLEGGGCSDTNRSVSLFISNGGNPEVIYTGIEGSVSSGASNFAVSASNESGVVYRVGGPIRSAIGQTHTAVFEAGGVTHWHEFIAGGFTYRVTIHNIRSATGSSGDEITYGSVTLTGGVVGGDADDPIISNMPSNITIAAETDQAYATVTWTEPTAFDDFGVASFTSTHASGSQFPLGTTTVTYTARDAAGFQATASFDVTVRDEQLPVLVGMPVDITVPNDPGLPSAVVTWTLPTATDNAPNPTAFQWRGPAPGSSFPVGTTVVTYLAHDTSYNYSTPEQSFTVTVNDTEAPVFTTPTDITVSTDPARATAVVTYATPTATDNMPDPVVTQTAGLASGTAFPLGVTTLTFQAEDAAGNQASTSFTVTVTDTEPPHFVGMPSNMIVSTEPGLTTAVVTFTVPTVDDNVPGATFTQTAGPASGSTFPLGPTTIEYSAVDAAGNQFVGSFTVDVPGA
jgi:hypothetical protein